MPEPEELTSSRGKAAIGLLGCLAFVGISLLAEHSGDTDWMLQAAGAFFGICSLVFLVMLVRPHHLRLDPEGYVLSGGLTRTPKRIRWHDIDEFYVMRPSRGANTVAFTYADGVNVPFGGAFGRSGAVPGVWPDGAEALADRLNSYRDDALRSS